MLATVEFSDATLDAIVTGLVGVGLVLIARWLLRIGFRRYLRRAEARRTADDVARLRTRLTVVQRVIVAFLFAIVAWTVLNTIPATKDLGRALLASSAVLALIVGLAFSVPLGNLGAGLLLGFTQPIRLGDRTTVGGATGTVVEITLIHTILLTDDDKRIFIPNTQMIGSVVVNRSVQDPRRTVTVRLPIGLRAPVDRARVVVHEAIDSLDVPRGMEVSVLLSEIGDKTAWLTVTAHAPPDTAVERLASEVRERALAALAREELLPA
jgi:small-conductance mechanosensitive channel